VARLRCQVASAVLLIAAHSAGPAIKSSNIPYQDAAQTALSSSYALRIIPLSNGFPSIEIATRENIFISCLGAWALKALVNISYILHERFFNKFPPSRKNVYLFSAREKMQI